MDGVEQQLQMNLSRFLLVSLLLPQILKTGRVAIVGSITGNTNTIGGGLVLPFADLGTLRGMQQGSKGYVSEVEAGQRLAEVVVAPETAECSGVYWSWNGGAREVPKRDF